LRCFQNRRKEATAALTVPQMTNTFFEMGKANRLGSPRN
jgi:hypothetical protein